MAQGVLHAAWRAQVRMPADLVVVGFDDISEAAYFIPPLTTVRQESTELGRIAVRHLSRLIDSCQETGRIATLEPAWLQPELIVRASSVSLVLINHPAKPPGSCKTPEPSHGS